MPVILRMKGYMFWFYEADLDEPQHVYVSKDGKEARYWLNPIKVARASKFTPANLREINRIIDDNLDFLLKAWEEEQSKRANS